MKRVAALIHSWLVALDQFAYGTVAFLPALILGGPVPSPYETISSRCGRATPTRSSTAAMCCARWGVPPRRSPTTSAR